MIWSFKEDIAIYRGSNFVMVAKVKLVELEDEKGFGTDLTHVYVNGDFDARANAKAMVQIGEDMQEYGFDNFQIYRRCEVCNELFLKTSKNKMICSGKCRARKVRDKK